MAGKAAGSAGVCATDTCLDSITAWNHSFLPIKMKKTVLHPLRIGHRIGNCFENRVYQPLLDPHLENHPFLSLLLPFPLSLSFAAIATFRVSSSRYVHQASGDTFADWLRIDRLYCVWLHVSCLSSLSPLLSPSFDFFFSYLISSIVFSSLFIYSLIYICFSLFL